METNSTKRFSSRVDHYIKCRPSYPERTIDILRQGLNLSPSSIVADVGSGSGILSEMFLKNGNLVFGIEPNREMREAAERLLKHYPNFRSIDGSAESTGLDAQSIDIVTAGQAFHWFNVDGSRREFLRVMKPGGWVVLLWNDRRTDSTQFLRAYEDLLSNYSIDYEQVNHRNVDEEVLNRFFGNGEYRTEVLSNAQVFDFEGLRGRLLSSSYIPMKEDPKYDLMVNRLRRVFDQYESGGKVEIEYDTRIYYGYIRR